MPSPFPGMDPYLERPGSWADFHNRLMIVISDLLVSAIRPKYIVRVDERVYVEAEDDPMREEAPRSIAPDLRIIQRSTSAPFTIGPLESRANTATAIEAYTATDFEIREWRLEIVDVQGQSVITAIEVLSPSNKKSGSVGRQSYREKRQEVMHSATNLVEIDLLRTGKPFVATTVPHDYLVHVSTASKRPIGKLWPIQLSQELPTIDVPLSDADGTVPLNLQAVFTLVYDRAGYDLQLDYSADPTIELRNEDKLWADRLLKEKGMRP